MHARLITAFLIQFFIVTAVLGQAKQSTQVAVDRWLASLQNSDMAVRSAAAFSIEGFAQDAEGALSPLARALKHPDPFVRRCAAIAIGELAPEAQKTVPILLEAMGDADQRVRQFAAMSMIKLGAPAVPMLVTALDALETEQKPNSSEESPTECKADYVAYVLTRVEGPVIPALTELTRARERDEEPQIVHGLTKQQLNQVVDFIVQERLREVPEDYLDLLSRNDSRVEYPWYGGNKWKATPESVLPKLRKILQDSSKEQQLKAISLLHSMAQDGLPLLLETLKSHPNSEVRRRAAEFIGRNAEVGRQALASTLANDSSGEVRAECARQLSYLLPQRSEWQEGFEDSPPVDSTLTPMQQDAVTALVKALRDPDTEVRAVSISACSSVNELPHEERHILIETLVQELKCGDGKRQQSAASAILNFKVPVPALSSVLLDGIQTKPTFPIGQLGFGSVQESFILALANVSEGNEQIEARIFEILNSNQTGLYEACYRILAKLKSKRGVPNLVLHFEFYCSKNVSLAVKAGQALVAIKPEGVSALITILEDLSKPIAIRETACDVLVERRVTDERLNDILLRATKDNSPKLRLKAAQGLANLGIGEIEAVQVFATAMQQSLDINSSDVVGSLAKYPDSAKREFTTVLRTDRGTSDRKRLIKELTKLSSTDARVEASLSSLHAVDYADSNMRQAIIQAIGKLQWLDDESIALITQQLSTEDDYVRYAALTTIQQYGKLGKGADLAIPPISDYLQKQAAVIAEKTTSKTMNSVDESRLWTALQTIQAYGPTATAALPTLIALANSSDSQVRVHAIETLGLFVDTHREVQELVRQALDDSDQAVRSAAIKAAFQSEALQSNLEGLLLQTSLGFAIDKNLAPCLERMDRIRRPRASNQIMYDQVAKAAGNYLPRLPWPPPKWSHRGVFGQDFPRELLGDDQTKLGEVQKRLFEALQRVDPAFSSSLFSVPDGFAMLAKLERINADGTPLGNGKRWFYGELAPLSLSDYMSRLFFEKPGFFRVVAFVVTSETNFGSSDKPLPPISSEGSLLPSELKELPFKGRECYVLVYSFERRPGGAIKRFESLSAKIHLERSGILSSIGK